MILNLDTKVFLTLLHKDKRMPLQSMTGFARIDCAENGLKWYWEARSVNNKSLDIKLKIPHEYTIFEQNIRETVSRRFIRGSLLITLNILPYERSSSQITLNEQTLSEVLKAFEYVRKLTGGPPPTAEGLLGIKGVLEILDVNQDLQNKEQSQKKIMETFEEVLSKLLDARESEGKRLTKVVSELIEDVSKLTTIAQHSPKRTPEMIQKRLREQISRLLEEHSNLDTARLHQEAILIATRSDIEEEIQRLHSHIQSFRELLAGDGSVGRKLEFLWQELSREANTLTSKAIDLEITKIGLELKSHIDQIREQVQNIE